jgi:hypothetical protein
MGLSHISDLLKIKAEKLLVRLVAVLFSFMSLLCYHSVQNLLSSSLLFKN